MDSEDYSFINYSYSLIAIIKYHNFQIKLEHNHKVMDSIKQEYQIIICNFILNLTINKFDFNNIIGIPILHLKQTFCYNFL